MSSITEPGLKQSEVKAILPSMEVYLRSFVKAPAHDHVSNRHGQWVLNLVLLHHLEKAIFCCYIDPPFFEATVIKIIHISTLPWRSLKTKILLLTYSLSYWMKQAAVGSDLLIFLMYFLSSLLSKNISKVDVTHILLWRSDTTKRLKKWFQLIWSLCQQLQFKSLFILCNLTAKNFELILKDTCFP